jgi:uncharacterized protein
MNFSQSLIALGLVSMSINVSADLFFSEYVEGSGNSKALEIYNNTGASVDLSNYQVSIYFNGSLTAASNITLSGTLANGDVYVIAAGGADAAILAVADQIFSSSFFNGDDAIELLKNGAVVDSIGQVGFDPGSEWGTGNISTQDNTIRRVSTVTSGDTNSSDVFDPSLQWTGFAKNTFAGLGVIDGEVTPPAPQFAFIHDIQGGADVSPMLNNSLSIEAIVVGDFQNNTANDSGDLNGFYVQEEDADVDADTSTSEGLFVYDGNGAVDVKVGDRVMVQGKVFEHYQLTELSASRVEVVASGVALPTVSDLTLPLASADELEAFEGMLVRFPQDLMISEYFNFDRYGEIVLALPLDGEQRPMTPSAMELPGSAQLAARQSANSLSRIILDDGRTTQNPDPAYHPNGMVFDLSNRFRGGDRLQNTTGVLDYRYSLYRIQPTVGANHIITNPRPEVPPYLDADIKVASFNVLNYFTTLDASGNKCGPDLTLDCRGANNAEEFMRQRDKIIQAIAAINADIVGLIEIENNDVASITDLVEGLNSVMGAASYSWLDTGFIGEDAIKVAFIYKPSSVATLGDYAILNSSVDERFIDTKNRPALAQTFISKRNAGRLTVVVNHLKSKGSDCDDINDPDLNDGSGNCNMTRSQAAVALTEWLASNPTGSGDGDNLIIGDLNSYDHEQPVSIIKHAGYTDLLLRDQGEQAYTYVFDGQYGYLDYALVSTRLESQATQAAVWHINADEPDLLDYDTSYKLDAQDALYEANPFRSSDHDPVMIGFNLDTSMADILAYVDQAIASGELVGVGKHKANQLIKFRKMLLKVKRLEKRSSKRASCQLLHKAQKKLDSEHHAHHHSGKVIAGIAAETVSEMIANYREENCH